MNDNKYPDSILTEGAKKLEELNEVVSNSTALIAELNNLNSEIKNNEAGVEREWLGNMENLLQRVMDMSTAASEKISDLSDLGNYCGIGDDNYIDCEGNRVCNLDISRCAEDASSGKYFDEKSEDHTEMKSPEYIVGSEKNIKKVFEWAKEHDSSLATRLIRLKVVNTQRGAPSTQPPAQRPVSSRGSTPQSRGKGSPTRTQSSTVPSAMPMSAGLSQQASTLQKSLVECIGGIAP